MSDLTKQSIRFSNNHSAIAVLPTADHKAEDIITALGLSTPKAALLVIGGADDMDAKLLPRLTQLFGRGIARAAVEAKALIIDGGTNAGVMSLMGEGVAARGYESTLIGVAPASKVSYPGHEQPEGTPLEPNHSHFVLVEGSDWGSETSPMFNLLNALTVKQPAIIASGRKPAGRQRSEAPSRIPVIVVLAGGGEVSRKEVLRTVRLNLPLIVVEGSGGLADEMAAAFKEKDKQIDDPVMAEIIADGELHFHSLTNSVKGIERLIIRELGSDKVLMQAWETFANYDISANLHQKRFDRLQLSIIIIGVISVALVVIQQVFAPRDSAGNLLAVSLTRGNIKWWVIYHFLIMVPILLTILVTAANRFKQGNKWLLLRSGAEAIKREIYRYRSRALQYANNGEQQLSKTVEAITRSTMRTEVNMSALLQYDKNAGFPPYIYAAEVADDGFSFLTPDRYVEVRLNDQLNYFQRKTPRLERQLRRLYWLTFIVGGVGSFLAAVGMQAWVALTTTVAAALGTYLGYRQTENTLMKYNQAATDLANVKAWWDALSSEEQAQQVNIDSLVDHTENILQSELDGWIQQMQNALADLRKGQEPGAMAKETETGDETEREIVLRLNKPGVEGKAQTVTVKQEVEVEKPVVIQTPAEPETESEQAVAILPEKELTEEPFFEEATSVAENTAEPIAAATGSDKDAEAIKPIGRFE